MPMKSVPKKMKRAETLFQDGQPYGDRRESPVPNT